MASKKIKISILECDSSHTEAYTILTNFEGSPFIKDAVVTCIYSTNLEQAKKKARALNIQKVTNDINDALKGIDCAMVIGRFADSHFPLAKTALMNGIPVFLDKPFVENSTQAEELVSIAKGKDVPLMACSPFRFDEGLMRFKENIKTLEAIKSVLVTGPFECNDLGDDPRLKDVFFYGSHVTEIINEIFGNGVESVFSKKTKLSVHGIISYKSGLNISLNLIKGTPFEIYRVYTMNETEIMNFSIKNVKTEGLYYKNTLNKFLNFVKRGHIAVTLESSLESFKVLEAFRSSFQIDKTIFIK